MLEDTSRVSRAYPGVVREAVNTQGSDDPYTPQWALHDAGSASRCVIEQRMFDNQRPD